MAGLMDLFPRFLTMVVTMPFSLFKMVCTACLSTIFVVIQTWMELVKAAVSFHVNMFWKAVTWTVALLSLPLRLLTALQRERLLEQHLRVMQFELETLVWERKEMKDHLQEAVRERRIMESMLIELEQEHDKAVARIELLKAELQDLKDENLRLKETQGEEAWSFRGHDHETKKSKSPGTVDNHVIPYGIASWISSCKGSGISLQDLMMDREVWEGKGKSNAGLVDFLKASPAPSGSVQPLITPSVVPNLEGDAVLEQRRELALSQTLFSAVLSLLVGMIVWEAEDPCMPLVVALFTVVGMSLRSVIQFFFTIRNKPASNAVVLLSFNWFMLGTLSYPTLPKLTRTLAPLALSLVDWMASCLGVSFN